MDWKKICKALIFPHIAIAIVLLPLSIVLLVYAMVCLGTESLVAIVSYVLAAYTLTVWCFKIPYVISFFKNIKNENKLARRWLEDTRFRVNVTLFGSVAWNLIYAVFQLWLGIYHSTLWFCSLAGYYFTLALMRFYLVMHTRKYSPGENVRSELVKYRACGWIFLLMNLALTLMIFFMVYWNRTFVHHEITTIAMAAYTFTAFTFAIINIVKYRKYNSPILSATKSISLAAASVSMLTLESTMLTTFDDGSLGIFARKMMLGASGGAISIFIIAMAIYMIVQSTRNLRLLNDKEMKNAKQ